MNRTTELLLAVLLIALLVSDFMYSRELSSYASHEQRQYHKESKNYKQESGSPLLTVITDIEKCLEAHEKTLIVLSTIAIALFTGTLWRATTGLQELAARQSDDMKESLRIANESAKAAKRTVETMEDTAKKELRAYVAVDDIYIPYDRTHGRPYILQNERVRIIIKNFGRTPAKKVTVNLGGKWAPNAGGGEWRYIDRNYAPPVLDLAPTQIYETRFSPKVFDVVGGRLGKRESDGFEPFFFGSISYQDIHGGWWRNDFCFHYDCKIDSPRNRFIPHQEHQGENSQPYDTRDEACNAMEFEN